MNKRLLSVCLIVFAPFAAAAAHAGEWTVTRISGHVYLYTETGAELVSLSPGATLDDGQILVADKSGRALLTRGSATMTVSPRTIIALPKDDGALTKILEETGDVEFDVDHQKTPHFVVETPYLAAVVKGTHFRVRASKKGAEVTVLRGKVEVDALASGKKTFIVAGQTATVSRGGKLSIAGTGILPPIEQGKPALPDDGLDLPIQLRADSSGLGIKAGPASAGIGSSGVTAGVGTTAAASVGAGGVNAGALGGTLSVGVGQGGINAGVGGLGVSVGLH